MIVEIAKLLRGEQHLEGECPAEVLDIPHSEDEPRPKGPIRYEIEASLAEDQLLVYGRLELDVEFVCSRCGGRFTLTVREGGFSVTQEVVDFAACVDLTDEAREATLLAFPTHPLCRKDCRGLCAQCGTNLNQRACACKSATDIRWSGLDDIRLN